MHPLPPPADRPDADQQPLTPGVTLVACPAIEPADPPVRFGILGAARITRRLAPTFAEARGARLVAVASRDADKAAEKAAAWGCRAHASYEALLADPDVEAVYIPVPNGLHAAWCVRALEAGKMVLCEKALVTSAAEIAALRSALARTGGWLEETVQYRHHPLTERAAALVRGGALGLLRGGSAQFDFILEPGNIRWDAALGGGVSLDLGIYCVGIWRALSGEQPEAVAAERVAWADGPTGPVDVEVAGRLFYPSGWSAAVSYSYRRPLHVGWTLTGARASLHSPHDFAYNVHDRQPEQELWLRGAGAEAGGPRVLRAERVVSSYTAMVEECAARWRRGLPPRWGVDDAEANLRVLLALLESGRRDGIALDPARLA